MHFDPDNHKSVIVIDKALPLGLAINAVSVIGVSLGRLVEGIVGQDVFSADNRCYPGVVKSPLPILHCTADELMTLQHLLEPVEGVLLLPFSNLAQSCRSYDDYEAKLSHQPSDALTLAGLGIVGPKKQVNKATGALALYK